MTRNTKEFVNQNADAVLADPALADFGQDHVRILLGLFNGSRTLQEQLESLACQTHGDWSLIISDDGSSDDWLDVVSRFSADHAPDRTWLARGPGQGFARNFLSLAQAAGPLVPFAAFCDQDDAWMPGKLTRALDLLKSVPGQRPGLYCGRTAICDERLRPLRLSPCFRRAPGFANALVQNIGGGNTMVMNRAALDLVQDTAHVAEDVASHDWWVYQLISGAGGVVIYDSTPTVLYRQHDANQIGANDTLRAGLKRFSSLVKGRYRSWNDRNLAALKRADHWLTDEARQTLSNVHLARRGPLLSRLASLRRSGVYRQRLRGTVALWIAATFNRF